MLPYIITLSLTMFHKFRSQMQQQFSFVFDIEFDEKYILFTLKKTAQRKNIYKKQ